MMTIANPFGCVQCKYFSNRKANLQKHLTSKRHKLNTEVTEKDENCKFQCKVCNKKYLSQPGLWGHNKKCKPAEEVAVAVLTPPETDLHAKIDNLERIILTLVNNQQPPTTINNDNRINNCIDNSTKNYINVFLNDKCGNACDIKKFIAGIDFSKENYQNILQDYVGGNAEIITKSYKNLPEFERPVYSFSGEDENQKVAHIQHDDKWIVEHEVSWMNQVRREYNDGVNDDPLPNSMYSLVRLFDKKKMEYFDENYKQSHLYLSQRKLNKDCLDDGKQLELINKIIEMAVVL
jgi:hypothetical protein